MFEDSRLYPLILVFLSGLGFSIQALFVKLLEQTGIYATFVCVFVRGFSQLVMSAVLVAGYYKDISSLIGETKKVRIIMFLRSVIGFGGIGFSFLAIERLPIGDATVLTMLSPFVAAIAAIFVLGEAWTMPDFLATCASMIGATCVARPSFIFGHNKEGNLDSIGVIEALVSSLSAGFAFIFIRMLGTFAKMPWPSVCVIQGLGQVILSIPFFFIFEQILPTHLTWYQFSLFFFGGIIGSFSQIAMTIGMQREKSATASAMRMSDVVFGFAFQVLFTTDEIGWLSIIGSVIVAGSIIALLVFKQIEKPSTTTTTTTIMSSSPQESIIDNKVYMKVQDNSSVNRRNNRSHDIEEYDLSDDEDEDDGVRGGNNSSVGGSKSKGQHSRSHSTSLFDESDEDEEDNSRGEGYKYTVSNPIVNSRSSEHYYSKLEKG